MNVEEAKAQIVEEHGEDVSSSELISFCQSNWTVLTGMDPDEMYAEQEFADEVLELAREFGVSYDSLCENW